MFDPSFQQKIGTPQPEHSLHILVAQVLEWHLRSPMKHCNLHYPTTKPVIGKTMTILGRIYINKTLYKFWLRRVFFSKIISITLVLVEPSFCEARVRGLCISQKRLFWQGVFVQPLLMEPGKPAYWMYPASLAAQTDLWFLRLPSITSTWPHPPFEHLCSIKSSNEIFSINIQPTYQSTSCKMQLDTGV